MKSAKKLDIQENWELWRNKPLRRTFIHLFKIDVVFSLFRCSLRDLAFSDADEESSQNRRSQKRSAADFLIEIWGGLIAHSSFRKLEFSAASN